MSKMGIEIQLFTHVDKVLGGQVDHASSNLLGNVQHLGLGELHQDTVLTVCH